MVQENSRQSHAVFGGMPTSNPPGRTPARDPFPCDSLDPGAEGAAIEVLALIDWAAEFVEISRSPVLEIPGFLKRPFIKGKLVKHPIPDDPAKSIHKEKCV